MDPEMKMVTFDTHATIKQLMVGGLKEKAAEVIVKAIKESKDSDLANLASKEQVTLLEKDVANIMRNVATKSDLAELKGELKSEISELRTELKTEIAGLRTEVRTEIVNVEKRLDEKIHGSERRLMLMIGGAVVTICSIILGALKYL